MSMFKNAKIRSLLVIATMLAINSLFAQKNEQVKVSYVDELTNSNHPQIGYWFITPSSLIDNRYLVQLDSIIQFSKFDLVFLSARNGVNFFDNKKMFPVFKAIVEKAHQHHIKIGLQFFEDSKTPVAIENTDRYITELEFNLDENGVGEGTGESKHVRGENLLIKSELLKAYAFKKTGNGFFDKASLTDVTDKCKWESPSKNKVTIKLDGGQALKGYTVYVALQHFYNFSTNLGADASLRFTNAMAAYKSIPLDGICLDEYANMRPIPKGDLDKKKEVFRERLYSLPMAKKFKEYTGTDLEKTLFLMRYAPTGEASVRMKAINTYMDFMRKGPLFVEQNVYDSTKAMFGKKAFIAAHDTYHNKLTTDEIWATGINWWNIPREYGQTDELTPLPTQMGIAFNYPENVLYNMFYHKDINKLTEKALTDLRYGIRTHYHAFNDIRWGISLEKPEAIAAINPVENCARLLNRFNPSLPEVKLLVIFGIEALANWYPNETNRGLYDINDKLAIEEKAVAIWEAGYANALIPTDLIEKNRLSILSDGKVKYNDHVFDAVAFLNPQYSKETTLKFLEELVNKKGKLLIEGTATNDFMGNDITNRVATLRSKTVADSFIEANIPKLGIAKNKVANGCKNADGSFVFTDFNSLKTKQLTNFSFQTNGNTFSGTYAGMLAIQLDKGGVNLEKLAANGFSELKKNGETILALEKPIDLIITKSKKGTSIEFVDKAHSIKITQNRL